METLLKSLFGFGPSCDIEFELDKTGSRKSVEYSEDGKKIKNYIYYDGEDVSGTVCGRKNCHLFEILCGLFKFSFLF